MKTKDVLIAVAKYGIGIALLVYVVSQNWAPRGNNPGIKGLLEKSPDWSTFAAVAGLLATVCSIQFVRWYLLVRAVNLPFTVKNAFRLGLVGAFYNTFLPGSIGGDFVKGYFIYKEQPGRKAAAVATVIADRFLGLFGLWLFAAVVGGVCWATGDPRVADNGHLRTIITFCGTLATVTVVGFVIMMFLSERSGTVIDGRLKRAPKIGTTLSELWEAAWLYSRRPKVVLSCVVLSAIAHTGLIFSFHCATRVFPSDPASLASLSEHYVIGPIGFIVQAFFFLSPGGLGGGEAIFGYLYTLLNLDETTGVVGRLTLRVVEWSVGLVGYIFYLRMKKDLPAEEPPAAPSLADGHDAERLAGPVQS